MTPVLGPPGPAGGGGPGGTVTSTASLGGPGSTVTHSVTGQANMIPIRRLTSSQALDSEPLMPAWRLRVPEYIVQLYCAIDRGLEYMFQFRMALPLNLIAMVTEKGLYQPTYYPDVNRLLVIPMNDIGKRLQACNYYKDPKSRFGREVTSSFCRRVDSIVDIQLRPDEQALIDKIANTPGIHAFVEHHGWYDNNYVALSLDWSYDSPHVNPQK